MNTEQGGLLAGIKPLSKRVAGDREDKKGDSWRIVLYLRGRNYRR